jgi:hypothetical protein
LLLFLEKEEYCISPAGLQVVGLVQVPAK